MKLVGKIGKWYYNLKLRTKLIVVFVILNVVTVLLSSLTYTYASRQSYEELVRENALSIIGKNNKVIDSFMLNIEKAIDRFSYDEFVYDALENIDTSSDFSISQADKTIQRAMSRYIDTSMIQSHVLVTSDYYLGSDKLANGEWVKTDFYQQAIEAKGDFVWIPTFVFNQEFQMDYLSDVDYSYKYIFSCAKQLTIFKRNLTDVSILPQYSGKPVLFINFSPTYFTEFFQEDVPIKGTNYMVIDENASLIYSSVDMGIDDDGLEKMVEQMGSNDEGIIDSDINDQHYILCFSRSHVTNWITLALINKDLVNEKVDQNLRMNKVILPLVLLIGMIIVAFSANQVTKPLKKLVKAFERTKKGEFGTTVRIQGSNDIDDILVKFNEMSVTTKKLIRENYEIHLLEKEAEMQALLFQLQPHFLYNTLNLVNCMAIEHDDFEMSKIMITLSSMLRYTADNKKTMGVLSEELQWLKEYFYIMGLRFEDKIDVDFQVDEEIVATEVPKLFLQPFIENIFVHGLQEKKGKWCIHISMKITPEGRQFIVTDNGKGILPEKLEELNDFEGGQETSIGIHNVRKRLVLIYGEKAQVIIKSSINEGTIVEIVLP